MGKAHGTHGLQPQRDAAVRWGAWLAGYCAISSPFDSEKPAANPGTAEIENDQEVDGYLSALKHSSVNDIMLWIYLQESEDK